MATQEQGLTTYAGPQGLTAAPTNWNEIQRVFARMVSKSEDDNQVIATMIACKELGFNPVLNHVFLIKGSVYVSHKGLLNLAHRSGKFDGIELLEEWESETHWLAKVAVHRKDMSRPFIYTGRYPKRGERSAYGPEMAVTRAETMALRRAFDVGLPVKEEIDALEGEYRVSEAAPSASAAIAAPDDAEPIVMMSEDQFNQCWRDVNAMAANKTPSKEIVAAIRFDQPRMTPEQYAEVLTLTKAILAARKAGQEWVPQARQPDALTQEIIEADVTEVITTPARRVLDHETFAEVQHSIAKMASAGSADKDITAYMTPFWQRGSDAQRAVIEKLWAAISAARQAGEAWPDPDAELQAELAYGQEEIGEPSGDPSLVDDSPFAHGAPASIAG